MSDIPPRLLLKWLELVESSLFGDPAATRSAMWPFLSLKALLLVSGLVLAPFALSVAAAAQGPEADMATKLAVQSPLGDKAFGHRTADGRHGQ